MWLTAPFTGVPDDPRLDVTFSTTRYLGPAIAAAAVAVALGYGARAAASVLAVAALISFERLVAVPSRVVPGALLFIAAALAGALTIVALRRLAAPARVRLMTGGRARAAGASVAVAAALALTVIANGFVARHGGVYGHPSADAVLWLAANPAYRDGDAPVAFAPVPLGPLAGDHLEHRLELIGADEPCERIRARMRSEWLVVGTRVEPSVLGSFTAAECTRSIRADFEDDDYRVFAPTP